MAQCTVNYWGLEVIRTDFAAPYCIVPNRNLQGLPKHLNEHPKVSEQNLLPQNMVWCTREASRAPGDATLEGPRIRPHQDFPARTQPHQTPHHRGEGGGFPPSRHHTPQGGERGREIPNQPHHNTHHRREAASQTIWRRVGGAERVTMYIIPLGRSSRRGNSKINDEIGA